MIQNPRLETKYKIIIYSLFTIGIIGHTAPDVNTWD